MIVREDERGLLAIRQPDHARICGEMARAWGHGGFAAVRPLDPVAVAAAVHDDGWIEWEDAPRYNPRTRRPYTYVDIPIEQHLEIYRRGIARAVERGPYVGLLVSLHGALLYARFRRGEPGAAAFIEEQRALQDRLVREMSADPKLRPHCEPAVVEANRDLIFAWDALSLVLCLDDAFVETLSVPAGFAGERTELRLRRAGDAWTLDPYPFSRSPLTLSAGARPLPRSGFDGEPAMRRALAEARELRLEFELRAP